MSINRVHDALCVRHSHQAPFATRSGNRCRLCGWAALAVVLATSAPTSAAEPIDSLRILPKELLHAPPAVVGMNAADLAEIDQVAAEGIAAGEMPGCVVLIARAGVIVFLKAYGHRRTEPEEVPMTVDTVFDMASLTKPVATATSLMVLIDQGKVKLHDTVAKHLEEFGQNGKQGITVYQLLTHQGGLTPDNSLADYADGPSKTWERIFALGLREPPGTKFIYTDVGYMVLAELVRRVSGQAINEFSRQNIFEPLGMDDTGYLPDDSRRRRAASTESRDDHWMQGEVHDPRAYALGGVAGHAGLFSTAEDLAIYAQMMLGGGRHARRRVLKEETVRRMTTGYPVSSGLRGLGWDVRTGYSSNRGEGFSSRAFGHGGFTGTAMWIDPGLDLTVIFLASRLHPDGKGSVNRLAGRIGGIAADAIQGELAAGPPVLTGIDVLVRDGFRQLDGRRVGLITNQTGVDREGKSTVQRLSEADAVQLVALFSPEHGLQGQLDQPVVSDGHEERTGLPVHSLYGATRRPTPEWLEGIDTLVFDIQDIGTRYYTYISTMGNCMQAAAEQGLRFVVLDRPNPIGGEEVAGPVLDAGRESFVAFHRLPVRHGMTIGELARMFKAELQWDLDLEVVRVEGWRRSDLWEATGLRWVNPSPNMRSPTEALLYPGIGLLETTNLSVGRGTPIPFEVIGSPWLDGVRLAAALERAKLSGVRFTPITYCPTASKFAGQVCGGLRITIADRDTFQPVRAGLEMARQLRLLYPDDWQAQAYDRLLGNRATLAAVLAGESADAIESRYEAGLREFLTRRERFLLYE